MTGLLLRGILATLLLAGCAGTLGERVVVDPVGFVTGEPAVVGEPGRDEQEGDVLLLERQVVRGLEVDVDPPLIGPGEPAVAAAIPEGRAILESLGAEPLLARLRAAEESWAASDAHVPASAPSSGMGTPPSAPGADAGSELGGR